MILVHNVSCSGSIHVEVWTHFLYNKISGKGFFCLSLNILSTLFCCTCYSMPKPGDFYVWNGVLMFVFKSNQSGIKLAIIKAEEVWWHSLSVID